MLILCTNARADIPALCPVTLFRHSHRGTRRELTKINGVSTTGSSLMEWTQTDDVILRDKGKYNIQQQLPSPLVVNSQLNDQSIINKDINVRFRECFCGQFQTCCEKITFRVCYGCGLKESMKWLMWLFNNQHHHQGMDQKDWGAWDEKLCK